MVTSEVGFILPRIQILHTYKEGDKDPAQVPSHRPLGLADPHLSLLSDLIYIRISIRIAAYVGPNQQGGQTDPRFMVILQSDAKGVRVQMGLPTVDSNVDAR